MYNFKSLMNKPKITTFVASICQIHEYNVLSSPGRIRRITNCLLQMAEGAPTGNREERDLLVP